MMSRICSFDPVLKFIRLNVSNISVYKFSGQRSFLCFFIGLLTCKELILFVWTSVMLPIVCRGNSQWGSYSWISMHVSHLQFYWKYFCFVYMSACTQSQSLMFFCCFFFLSQQNFAPFCVLLLVERAWKHREPRSIQQQFFYTTAILVSSKDFVLCVGNEC